MATQSLSGAVALAIGMAILIVIASEIITAIRSIKTK